MKRNFHFSADGRAGYDGNYVSAWDAFWGGLGGSTSNAFRQRNHYTAVDANVYSMYGQGFTPYTDCEAYTPLSNHDEHMAALIMMGRAVEVQRLNEANTTLYYNREIYHGRYVHPNRLTARQRQYQQLVGLYGREQAYLMSGQEINYNPYSNVGQRTTTELEY